MALSSFVSLIVMVFLLQSVSGGSYVDSSGAFSLSFPAGWTVAPGAGQGTVRLLRGRAEFTVNHLQGP